MNKKTISRMLIVLVVVIIMTIGSWIAGTFIKSPAELAAQTAPPVPSPILVPIEQRVLSANVVTRGTARFGLPQAVSIVPSFLKETVGLITTLPELDSQLNEGDILFTVSGRPQFVLQGNIPTFRDLTPGISGDDVWQLEEGLQRLGFDPGSVDGFYDEETSYAVADWYMASGWEPFSPTTEQITAFRHLEDELARVIHLQWLAESRLNIANLKVDLVEAEVDNTNQALLASEGDGSQADLQIRQLTGEMAIQEAVNAQQEAEREVEMASLLVTRLSADLETMREKVGVQIPADEIIFIPTLPARIEQVNVAIGEPATGSVAMITNNQLSIDSSLPLDEAPLVKPNMVVTIDEPDLGIQATGVVKQVATSPGTDGIDGFHVYFEVAVNETPHTLEGFSLRLTIPVESTGGQVTAVPISAVSLAADGISRVQVQQNGSLEFVVVDLGLSADGFVEIIPVQGTLEPNQLVVVGSE